MIRIIQEYGERKTRWTLEITSGQIPPSCLEGFIADLRKAARTVETLNRGERRLDTGGFRGWGGMGMTPLTIDPPAGNPETSE